MLWPVSKKLFGSKVKSLHYIEMALYKFAVTVTITVNIMFI